MASPSPHQIQKQCSPEPGNVRACTNTISHTHTQTPDLMTKTRHQSSLTNVSNSSLTICRRVARTLRISLFGTCQWKLIHTTYRHIKCWQRTTAPEQGPAGDRCLGEHFDVPNDRSEKPRQHNARCEASGNRTTFTCSACHTKGKRTLASPANIGSCRLPRLAPRVLSLPHSCNKTQ